MTHPLEVLVRDREFRPRGDVEVVLRVGRADVLRARTDLAGLARFVVPDIATVTVVIDGVEDTHPVRMFEGRVRRIAIAN